MYVFKMFFDSLWYHYFLSGGSLNEYVMLCCFVVRPRLLLSESNIHHRVLECLLTVLQFNFVGRILGPRGMTTKQIEQNTGCKIMIRGKGSMRDRKKVSQQSMSTLSRPMSMNYTALYY